MTGTRPNWSKVRRTIDVRHTTKTMQLIRMSLWL